MTPEIMIDEEFRNLLPALDDRAYQSLERDIVQNGVHTPIVVWNGYIIDGHNRYEICSAHDVPFETIDHTDKLTTREDVILWIIMTQISRRNLTAQQLSYYRGRQYQIEKKRIGDHGSYQQAEAEMCQFDTFQPKKSTAKRLADQYNVSTRTIMRDSSVAQVIDTLGGIATESRRMILAGKAPISRNELEGLSRAPKDELRKVARDIVEGTYTKPQAHDAPDEADEANEANEANEADKRSRGNILELYSKTKVDTKEAYLRVLGDIAVLDSALAQLRESLSECFSDIHDAFEKNDIKIRLRMQAEEFSELMYHLSEI